MKRICSLPYCTCKDGNGRFCNHVYAQLKLVAQFILNRLDNVPQQLTCTYRPCWWTVPQVWKMKEKKDSVMDSNKQTQTGKPQNIVFKDNVPDVLRPKFEHGKMYEAVASDMYRKCSNEKSEKCDVYPSGLVINTN